jgi:membrane protease YdiL (CAAX protease family)
MSVGKFELSASRAIGFLLYYIFLGVIILGVLKYAIPTPNTIFLESVVLIAKDLVGQSLIVGLILWDIRRKHELDFELSFVGTINYKWLLLVLVITIGYFLWYHNSIGILAEKIPMGKLFTDYIDSLEIDLKRNPYPLAISALIVAPVFEEILMRGIVLKAFLRRYSPAMAIFLSALFFGLFHMNGPQFVNAFLIGLFLGFVYYSTQSLILCIAIHATNNSIAFLYDSDKHAPRFPAFLIGVSLFVAGLWYLRKTGMLSFRKLPQLIDSQTTTNHQIETKESISEEGSPGR